MDLADRKYIAIIWSWNRQQAITFLKRNGAPEDQETGTQLSESLTQFLQNNCYNNESITPAPKTFLSVRAK